MYRVSEPTQQADRSYEIRFNPSRTVEARRANGSPMSLEAATLLRVQTARVAGDSVTVRIGAWKGQSWSQEPDFAVATFNRTDPGLAFYERRMSTKKNLLLTAAILGGLALAAGQAPIAGGSGSWNVGGY